MRYLSETTSPVEAIQYVNECSLQEMKKHWLGDFFCAFTYDEDVLVMDETEATVPKGSWIVWWVTEEKFTYCSNEEFKKLFIKEPHLEKYGARTEAELLVKFIDEALGSQKEKP